MLLDLGRIGAAMVAMLVVYAIVRGHYATKAIFIDMLNTSEPGSGTRQNAEDNLKRLENDENFVRGMMAFGVFLIVCTVWGIIDLIR